LSFVVSLRHTVDTGKWQISNGKWENEMSLYDSRDLMSLKSVEREYNVPVARLELAVSQGALRVIEQNGAKWLLRPEVEQFVKRTVKRGAGNKVVTRINP
jgi:hypothetical protein